MAGASIIEIRDDHKAIDAALKNLQLVASNLKPVFADIGEYLLESTSQRFADGVDPEGKAWEDYAPLSESTKARKEKNADKILIEHGGLLGSLHPQSSADGVEFGTNLIYGATHQFGRAEAGIPARPFLGISVADEAEILNIITQHLSDALPDA